MKQHVKTIVYEFLPGQKKSLLKLIAVLYFKKIKFTLEEGDRGIKVVIPEEM